MSDKYVRVKQAGTGHELSVSRRHFDAAGDGAYELLSDKEAVDAAGEPLPPKYKTSVAKSAAKKATTSGQKAESKEES